MSSSAADLANKTPSDATDSEPNAKKAKLSTHEADQSSNNNLTDNNNGTKSTSRVNENSSTKLVTSGTGETSVPTKATNGADNESTSPQAGDDHDGSDSEESDDYDPQMATKLEEIEQIQTSIAKLNELASEEILKVEQKFNKLRRPHFEQRNQLLREVPNFWLTTLANHPDIAPMIDSAEDEDCLHYLVELDVQEFDDIKSGYKLKFHFNENPYIQNETIVREIQHVGTDEIASNSTNIEYKDTTQGKNLRRIVDAEKAQHGRTVRPNIFRSFFAWLSQPCETSSDVIAEIIKDQIWPSPLEFFFATQEYGSDESDEEDEYNEDDAGVSEDIPSDEVTSSDDDEELNEEELVDDNDEEEELGGE